MEVEGYNKAVRAKFTNRASDYEYNHTILYTTTGLHERERRQYLKELISRTGGRMLSIGCGTGWCLKAFSNDFSCTGIDISEGMLIKCKEEDLKVCCADGRNLPFKSGSFDLVVSINMFQYIPDPEGFISEVKRVLKSEGTWILDYKNSFSLRFAVHYLCERRHRKDDDEKRYGPFFMRRLFKKGGIKRLDSLGMEFHFLRTSTEAIPEPLFRFLEAMERVLSRTPFKLVAGRMILMTRPIYP